MIIIKADKIHEISAANSHFAMPNHLVGWVLLARGSVVANITVTRRDGEPLFHCRLIISLFT